MFRRPPNIPSVMNEWDICGISVALQYIIHTIEVKLNHLLHCLLDDALFSSYRIILSPYPLSLIRAFLPPVEPSGTTPATRWAASGDWLSKILGKIAILVIVQSWFYLSFRNGLVCIHGTTRQITIRFVYIIVPSCFETLSGDDKQPTSIVDKNLEFFPNFIKKDCGRGRTLGQMAFKGIKD